MSKKFVKTNKSASSIMHDYKTMTSEDFQQLYGIYIDEDGSVNDNLYYKSFNTVDEWALFSAEQDAEEDHSYDHKNFKSSADDYW